MTIKNNTSAFRISGIIRLHRIFTFLILTTIVFQASAQRLLVINALTKHGVDDSFLDPANLRTPADRSFDLKESTTTAGKTKVTLAKFNHSAAGRERWNLFSVDGKTPSLYETNMFCNTREKRRERSDHYVGLLRCLEVPRV